MLRGRRPDTPEEEVDAAFPTLASFRDGGIIAGSFWGDSPWERHPQDERIQILQGAATLTILVDSGPEVFQMTAGMLIVVPGGYWHHLQAPEGVTVLTATPQTTDHCFGEDPHSTH